MKKDRLRNDRDEIHTLDDLISARDPDTSHVADDVDSFDEDLEIPEDTDVDEALTFPHPKHKKSPVEDIELMDTPNEENLDEDWEDQDVLPTDYSHGYSEAVTTDPRDDMDEMVEDDITTIDYVTPGQVADQREIEVMPDKFTPDEETEET